MKIYLDTCCYCRPYDNSAHTSQARVKWEIAAVRDTVRLCKAVGFVIVGSAAVTAEMGRIKEAHKRERARGFYDETVDEELTNTPGVTVRARELVALGLKNLDPFHVAFAEAACVDFLLTTDDSLERSAERLNFSVKVINPTNLLEEYIKWLRQSM